MTRNPLVNHEWLLNATRCAVDRFYLSDYGRVGDERWTDFHCLNRYRIDHAFSK
jgi:hypothetical protein